MGSPCRIVLYAPDAHSAQAAAAAAFAEVAAIDASMSDWKPESELSRLNEAGEAVVSDRLFEVLTVALRIASLTAGAFDPTIGAAVRVWREERVPGEEERREILSKVGWRHLRLDPAKRRARIERPGVRLDLGGIAKGYAADRALAVLARKGVVSALVAVAGDISLGDPPPGAEAWRIAIGGDGSGVLLLRNRGVSTSGDAERFIEIDGARYSHIVDPRTAIGLPGGTQATVVAPSATLADALATAACVLGTEAGPGVAASFAGVEARVRSGGQEAETRGFAALLAPAGESLPTPPIGR
jgi:thiamine biosynthesis lipoprotein